jgi:ketosteroid isomerase-like protein
MSQENVEIVRSVIASWERGDYSSTDWAHPDIEFVIADAQRPAIGRAFPAWPRAGVTF